MFLDDKNGEPVDGKTIAFFGALKGEKKTRSVYIFNKGNAAVELTPGVGGPPFYLKPGGGDTVSLSPTPDEYQLTDVTFIPLQTSTFEDALTFRLSNGPLCSGPLSFALKGDSTGATEPFPRPPTTIATPKAISRPATKTPR